MIGFEDYVRAEGMVNRLVHTKSGVDEQVDIARLTKNIDKVYKYRSIHDDRVYKDDNMIRLVMNYAAAFSKAASHFAVNNQPQKAWQYAERARSFKVDELRMIDFYVRYYANTRKIDEFDQYLERNLYHRVDGAGIMLKYVLQYLEEYDPQLALSYYEKALMHFPQEDIVARFAVFFADERQMEAQVADLLERYQTTLSYSVDPFIQFLRQPQE
jgi:tetratricopeptide (TPR) repeat protein